MLRRVSPKRNIGKLQPLGRSASRGTDPRVTTLASSPLGEQAASKGPGPSLAYSNKRLAVSDNKLYANRYPLYATSVSSPIKQIIRNAFYAKTQPWRLVRTMKGREALRAQYKEDRNKVSVGKMYIGWSLFLIAIVSSVISWFGFETVIIPIWFLDKTINNVALTVHMVLGPILSFLGSYGMLKVTHWAMWNRSLALKKPTMHGPYAWVRHPEYACEFVFFSGILVALPSIIMLTIWLSLSLLTYIRIVTEEIYLWTRYGGSYLRYRQSVPCLMPEKGSHPLSENEIIFLKTLRKVLDARPVVTPIKGERATRIKAAAGILLRYHTIVDEWQVLLVQRHRTMPRYPLFWIFPSGKRDFDRENVREKPLEAILRELEEEVALFLARAENLVGRLGKYITRDKKAVISPIVLHVPYRESRKIQLDKRENENMEWVPLSLFLEGDIRELEFLPQERFGKSAKFGPVSMAKDFVEAIQETQQRIAASERASSPVEFRTWQEAPGTPLVRRLRPDGTTVVIQIGDKVDPTNWHGFVSIEILRSRYPDFEQDIPFTQIIVDEDGYVNVMASLGSNASAEIAPADLESAQAYTQGDDGFIHTVSLEQGERDMLVAIRAFLDAYPSTYRYPTTDEALTYKLQAHPDHQTHIMEQNLKPVLIIRHQFGKIQVLHLDDLIGELNESSSSPLKNDMRIETINALSRDAREDVARKIFQLFEILEIEDAVVFCDSLAELERILTKDGEAGLSCVCRNQADEVIGFILAHPDAGEGHIAKMGVKSSQRRQKIGTQLIHAFAQRAAVLNMPTVSLYVIKDNLGAIAFYERLGFVRYTSWGDDEFASYGYRAPTQTVVEKSSSPIKRRNENTEASSHYTSLFRYPWQYRALEEHMPRIVDEGIERGVSMLSALSLGSATGAEAISIAITCLSAINKDPHGIMPIKIQGIERSSAVVKQAETLLAKGDFSEADTEELVAAAVKPSGFKMLPQCIVERLDPEREDRHHLQEVVLGLVREYLSHIRALQNVSFIAQNITAPVVLDQVRQAQIVFLNMTSYQMTNTSLRRLGTAIQAMQPDTYFLTNDPQGSVVEGLKLDMAAFKSIPIHAGTVLRKIASSSPVGGNKKKRNQAVNRHWPRIYRMLSEHFTLKDILEYFMWILELDMKLRCLKRMRTMTLLIMKT